MKRYLFAVFFLVLAHGFLLGQSANKGTFHLDLHGGLGLGNVITNLGPDNESFTAYTVGGVSAGYSLHENLELGIELNVQPFFTENDSTRSTNVGSGFIGGFAKYHVLNREKSNMYIGFLAGVGGFEYSVVDSAQNVGFLEMGGTTLGLNFGYRKYFGQTIGFKAELGWLTQPYWGRRLTYNDVEYDEFRTGLDVVDTKIRISSINLKVGLTFKFGG